jgi:hypothetical protein
MLPRVKSVNKPEIQECSDDEPDGSDSESDEENAAYGGGFENGHDSLHDRPSTSSARGSSRFDANETEECHFNRLGDRYTYLQPRCFDETRCTQHLQVVSRNRKCLSLVNHGNTQPQVRQGLRPRTGRVLRLVRSPDFGSDQSTTIYGQARACNERHRKPNDQSRY